MNRLGKFEKVKIIGIRATQLSEGSEPCVDIKNMTDFIEIAEKEFEEGKIPLIILNNYSNLKNIKIEKFKI